MVSAVPLVSVDLIIIRDGHEVLLGLRNNRPAKNFWFVPGGRILKNELKQDAICRIVDTELGIMDLLKSGGFNFKFYGVYEHFYQDSFAGDLGISTHYVVLAYKAEVASGFVLPFGDEQHAALKWWDITEALTSPIVHQYVKDYFFNYNLIGAYDSANEVSMRL